MLHETSEDNLWAAAVRTLSDDTLRTLNLGETATLSHESIDDLINLTKEKQTQCDKKFWRFKIGSHELLLRDCATKIITCLHKFKAVGDVASQYDPVHSAIPWAVVRFLLQATISEREDMGAILVIIETTSRLILRCRVYENIYTPETIPITKTHSRSCLEQLRKDVVSLYAAILRALAESYSTLSKNTAKRAMKAIFRPGKTQGFLDELLALENRVVDQAQVCESQRSQKATDSLEGLLKNLDMPLFRIEENVSKVLHLVTEREQDDILEWVSTISYGAHHHAISRQRTPGTGEWLLQHQSLIEWHTQSSSAITVVYGDPGSGKTYLVSRAIDWIRQGLDSNDTDEAFAYFYCNRNEEVRRQPENILRSLIRQLSSTARAGDMLHEQLPKLKRSLRNEGRLLDIDKCGEVLLDLINSYPATTIVLDALDECEPDSRGELMTVLDDLMEQSHNPLKILISSRRDQDIRSHFQGKPTIEIQATDSQSDIAKFVHVKMAQDKRWAKLSPSLRREVETTLLTGSQGMFQWAALQIQQISKLKVWTAGSIRTRLGKLPETLEAAYNEIWKEIDELSPHEKQLAERAFQWVLCAQYPLAVKELTVAVLLDPDSDSADDMQDELDEDDVLGICSNLLCIDPELQVWRFCHLSAREYYERHHHGEMESHRLVASASLKYLLVAPHEYAAERWKFTRRVDIGGEHTLCRRETDENECNCFCTYVTLMWPFHVRKQADMPVMEIRRLIELLKQFFRSTHNSSEVYRSWLQKAISMVHVGHAWEGSSRGPLYEYFGGDVHRYFAPFSISLFGICNLGFFNLLRDWWEDETMDINVCTRKGPSLLTTAMRFNQGGIWNLLLRKGASLEIGTPTPLIRAIKTKDKAMFKMLIDAGADINRIDFGLQRYTPLTPLMADIYHGFADEELVFAGPLLAAGADVNKIIPQKKSRNILNVPTSFIVRVHPNALFQAIAKAFNTERNVELLLNHGADVNASTLQGNALDFALRQRKWDIARLLLRYGAHLSDPNTALLAMSQYINPLDLVQECITQGAEVNAHNCTTSALMNAISTGGFSETTELLLKLGADINSTVPLGNGTALTSAVDANLETLRRAIEVGGDVNLHNGITSPLVKIAHSRFSDNDKLRGIQMLLESGADVNQVVPFGPFGTALTAAASTKSTAVAQFLLDAGAHLDLGNRQSNPLFAAAGEYKSPILKLLLDRGADPNITFEDGYGSALANAAFWGQRWSIEILVDAGADLNMPLKGPFQNLWQAMQAGLMSVMSCRISMKPRSHRHEVIDTLFERGLNMPMPIYTTMTDLPSFVIGGHGEHRIESSIGVHWTARGHQAFALPLIWAFIMLELGLGPQNPRQLPDSLYSWHFPRRLPSSLIILINLRHFARPKRQVRLAMRIQGRNLDGPFLVKMQRPARVPVVASKKLVSGTSFDRSPIWTRRLTYCLGVVSPFQAILFTVLTIFMLGASILYGGGMIIPMRDLRTDMGPYSRIQSDS